MAASRVILLALLCVLQEWVVGLRQGGRRDGHGSTGFERVCQHSLARGLPSPLAGARVLAGSRTETGIETRAGGWVERAS